MRILIFFLAILVYLFCIVYIESELVKVNIRKNNLKNQVQELKNEKANLQAQIMELSNLAKIEIEARKRGFVFFEKEDILRVIR